MNVSMRMIARLPLVLAAFLAPFAPTIPPGSPAVQAQAGQPAESLLFQLRPAYRTVGLPDYLPQDALRSGRFLAQIAVWRVEIPATDLERTFQRIQNDIRIAWVEEDGWVHASALVPNDPFYLPQQANLALIGMPHAWGYTQGATDWPIAVIDTGIDLDHPDLDNKLWINTEETPANGLDDDLNGYVDDVLGWNYVADNNLPQDDYSHGSAVSGIAAARGNNGIGIAGIAWQTPLMALKALDSNGEGHASDAAEAILYAADNGARILNLSLGSVQEYQVITQAVDYAIAQGCLVIAAVGNDSAPVEYPAALPQVLAVAASNNSDQPASFSNRGPQVDLSAPGVEIFSLDKDGFYLDGLQGTSFSTPQVSGVAALIWGSYPEWSAAQVTEVLTATARDIGSAGKDDLTGWGRIDAEAAIRSLFPQYNYLPIVVGAPAQ